MSVSSWTPKRSSHNCCNAAGSSVSQLVWPRSVSIKSSTIAMPVLALAAGVDGGVVVVGTVAAAAAAAAVEVVAVAVEAAPALEWLLPSDEELADVAVSVCGCGERVRWCQPTHLRLLRNRRWHRNDAWANKVKTETVTALCLCVAQRQRQDSMQARSVYILALVTSCVLLRRLAAKFNSSSV